MFSVRDLLLFKSVSSFVNFFLINLCLVLQLGIHPLMHNPDVHDAREELASRITYLFSNEVCILLSMH